MPATHNIIKALRKAEKHARRTLQRAISDESQLRLYADPRWSTLFGEEKFLLIDGGAQGGLQKEFMPATRLLRVLAIEPRATPVKPHAGYETSPVDVTIVRAALAAEPGLRDFRVCMGGAMSSLLEPDVAMLTLFGLGANVALKETVTVPTTTLDALLAEHQLRFVDFVKLDTQGSELEILQGGHTTVGRLAFGLRLEVAFLHLYKSQPLFGDVDRYVRSVGFEFIDFIHHRHHARSQTGAADLDALSVTAGQLLSADAVYFRAPAWAIDHLQPFASVDRVRYLAGALLTCLIYCRLDYAAHLIAAAESLVDAGARDVMLDLLRAYATPSTAADA